MIGRLVFGAVESDSPVAEMTSAPIYLVYSEFLYLEQQAGGDCLARSPVLCSEKDVLRLNNAIARFQAELFGLVVVNRAFRYK